MEALSSAKISLKKLSETINLDKPGLVEAELDAVASELLESGLVELTHEAPSLAEVLTKIKEKHPMSDEAIDAAERLAYLIEANWYGEGVTEEEQQESERFATILYEKLAPLLDAYARA